MQIKIDPICFFNIASQYYHTRLSGILVGKITADCMHIQQSFDLPIENALEHYNDRIQQLQVFQLEPIGYY